MAANKKNETDAPTAVAVEPPAFQRTGRSIQLPKDFVDSFVAMLKNGQAASDGLAYPNGAKNTGRMDANSAMTRVKKYLVNNGIYPEAKALKSRVWNNSDQPNDSANATYVWCLMERETEPAAEDAASE